MIRLGNPEKEKIVPLVDEDGEFGFIGKNKKTGNWEFKLTEEKYLTVDDMETITSYMRTIAKHEGLK